MSSTQTLNIRLTRVRNTRITDTPKSYRKPNRLLEALSKASPHITQPAHGVFHQLQNQRILKNGIRLVPRTKVEDPPLAQIPNAAAAKPFASRPALLQHDFVRRGNMEWFIIHFGLFNG